MLADPIQVVIRVAQAFEGIGVPYLVGGSLASSQYGIPRSTQDVDLIADLQPNHVAVFLAALKDGFYIDADMVREAIRHRSAFNAIVQGAALDPDYLKHWATELGLTDLLDRALREAGFMM